MTSYEILYSIIQLTEEKIPYISLKSGISHQTLYRIHHRKTVSMRTRCRLLQFL